MGSASNRDAVGAKVALTLGSDRTLTRWVEAGSGYAAQSAYPLHFGLGRAQRVEAVEITWPSGEVARLAGADLGINRTLRVEEGGGIAVVAAAAAPPRPSAPDDAADSLGG